MRQEQRNIQRQQQRRGHAMIIKSIFQKIETGRMKHLEDISRIEGASKINDFMYLVLLAVMMFTLSLLLIANHYEIHNQFVLPLILSPLITVFILSAIIDNRLDKLDRLSLPYCIDEDFLEGDILTECLFCGTVQEVDTSDRSKEDYHGKKGGM